MKIYIAGPMTGHVNDNRPAFLTAQRYLEEEAEKYNLGPPTFVNPGSEAFYRRGEDILATEGIKGLALDDIRQLASCDTIYMLTGWERSIGARCEHAFAVWAELTIWYQT